MKILICDDDVALLQVVQAQVDWASLGIHTVLTAQNGEEAKRILSHDHPDIVLSDISMPLCSGLELIAYVENEQIPCEFAFLTCYAEMSYMREAMRHGAKWYITKPVNFTELERELREITEAARKRRQLQVKEKKKENTATIIILRGLRDGLYGEDEALIDQGLRSHGLEQLQNSTLHYIGIRINQKEKALVQGASREIALLAEKEILGREDLRNIIVEVEQNKILYFLASDTSSYSTDQLLSGCEAFCRAVKETYGVLPICVISAACPIYRTYSVCSDLQKKLHTLRFQEGRCCMLNEDHQSFQAQEPIISEERLNLFFAQQDKAGLIRYVSTLISQGARLPQGDALIRQLHHCLMEISFTFLRQHGIAIETLFTLEEMQAADASAEQSGFHMLRFAQILFDHTQTLIHANENRLDSAEQAKNFIRLHYRENIDRDTIAGAIFVAPNYLSKLFHDKVGMSLREYINDMRIQEAKRLMLTTQKSITEIAVEVGFDNISYFSTVFRKIVGMSPAEWKGSPVLDQ